MDLNKNNSIHGYVSHHHQSADNTEYEQHYTFNDILYNIVAPRDVHERLQNDSTFCNTYLKDHVSSNEAICITESITEKGQNIGNIHFIWTKQSTQFLLEKYYERKDMFRDPKIKKKTLWTQIVDEFKLKSYDVNEEILDRKMRNLKQSYKNIKDNNKKTTTGRGRINWEWFNTMEDIFREDLTINIGSTLSSMASDNERPLNIEHSSTSLISSVTEPTTNSNTEIQTETTETDRESRSSISPIPEVLLAKSSKKVIQKHKAARSKTLYDLRKKHSDCEEKRVEAINKLREAIETNNNIQKERNVILQQLVNSQISNRQDSLQRDTDI